MAAHAAALTGHDVHIYSKKRKSEMFGAQFLHAPIPGMTDTAPVEIDYEWWGDYEGYRRKVYGELDVERVTGVKVSPEVFGGSVMAWNIRSTYDNLWQTYGEYVHDVVINAKWLADCLDSGDYDYVVSTIPAPIICFGADKPDGHACTFRGQTAYALGDAPERGMFVPAGMKQQKGVVVCNGLPAPRWYRSANVFGYATVEWPEGARPPLTGIAEITKPLTTNCNCHAREGGTMLLRLGRYGQWQKGVLTHHVFQQAMDHFQVAAV
jgi:hypothetical protein